MKRSEMVLIMADILGNTNCAYRDQKLRACERLLSAMEEYGMLPPGYRQTHTFNRYIITEFKIGYWEPEADKPLNGGLVADIKADEADKAKE